MTQQYLVGELSVLLARLEAIAGCADSARRVAQLRRDAESRPPWALADIEERALVLADALCWDSLIRGETPTFERQARLGAQLLELGICAGILAK